MNSQQIFKGKKLTSKKVVNNLLKYYYQASKDQINSGLEWYKQAHEFCIDLSKKSGLPVFKVAGIVAALSPQTNWQRNKEISIRFILNNESKGLHNSNQLDKAFECLHADNEKEIYLMLSKNQVKTSQFFYNILNYKQNLGVTIDRHALAATFQKPEKVKSLSDAMSKMTAKQYNFFMSCYSSAAQKVNILGHEFQAVLWLVYRDLRELPKEYKVGEIEAAPF